MKRLFLVILTVIFVSCGCVSAVVNGQRHFVLMPQVGVIMTVQNDCAPTLSIESLYGTEMKALPFGESATIPISSRAFSGDNREIWIMVKAYDKSLNYIGSAQHRESVDIYSGTRDRLWQVNRLESPSGAECKVR